MNDLAERLRKVRGALGLSQRQLAESTGISQAYLSQVESGKHKASIDILIGIASTYPQISRDWLLTGEGPMLRSEIQDWKARAEAAERALESLHLDTDDKKDRLSVYRQIEQVRLLETIGLGDVAMLARAGSQEPGWHVGCQLAMVFPEGLTLNELHHRLQSQGLEIDEQDLAAQLALMERRGIVQEDAGSEGRFRLKSHVFHLKALELPDLGQGIREAIRSLARSVLKARERGDDTGKFLTIRVSCPRGQGRQLYQALTESVKRQCIEAGVESGDDQVTVVFGIDVDTPTMAE